ncbi:MAG: EamA family transporter [Clostridia bacterium]|nr:EamA family transporter [Clostridia bacterium]
MWLVFALVCFFAWGAADLFYKRGAVENEKLSHLKTSVIVGLVMGVTAIVTLLVKNVNYDFRNLLVYLPVSFFYISSMTVGYFGLRYLEVSVSSPVQNASGAVSAILLMIFLQELPGIPDIVSMVLITAGVVLLGILERRKEVRYLEEHERKYKIGFIAFMMPIFYCILDALGTFLDGYYLDDWERSPLIGVTEDNIEDVANVSYQLTFLIVALILLFYILVIKREKFVIKQQGNRLVAALFETGGQLAYVYAMSGNGIVAAPVVASYCVFSMILGRIFLKEKLTWKQYLAIGLVVAGIVILGVLEGLDVAQEAEEAVTALLQAG